MRKKNVCMVIFVVFVILAIIVVFQMKGKNKKEERKIDDSFDESIMEESGETFQIDDYTITMEKYLYDQEMQLAAAVFRVDKSQSKPEADISEYSDERQVNSFGTTFYFDSLMRGEYKGDSLYIYYQKDDRRLNAQDNMWIELFSYSGLEPIHRFALQNTEKPEEIKTDEGAAVKISSLGMVISKKDYDKIEYISLQFKDGSKMLVMDKKDTYTLFDTYNYIGKNVAQFRKPIDMSKIEQIVTE